MTNKHRIGVQLFWWRESLGYLFEYVVNIMSIERKNSFEAVKITEAFVPMRSLVNKRSDRTTKNSIIAARAYVLYEVANRIVRQIR